MQPLYGSGLCLHEGGSAGRCGERLGAVARQQQSRQVVAKVVLLRKGMKQRIELHRISFELVPVPGNTDDGQSWQQYLVLPSYALFMPLLTNYR